MSLTHDFLPYEILKATERLYYKHRLYELPPSRQVESVVNLYKREAHRMLVEIKTPNNPPHSPMYSTTTTSAKEEHRFPGSVLYYDKDGTVKKTYIKRVIYSNPATIVFFGDGTKTICKASKGDAYNPAAGLAFCVYKKMIGASALVDVLEDWVPSGCEKEGTTYDLSLKDIRKKNK